MQPPSFHHISWVTTADCIFSPEGHSQSFQSILVVNNMAALLTIVTMAEPEARNNPSHGSMDSTNQVTCSDTGNGTYYCEGSLQGPCNA